MTTGEGDITPTMEPSTDYHLALFIVLPLILVCFCGSCIGYCMFRLYHMFCRKYKINRKLLLTEIANRRSHHSEGNKNARLFSGGRVTPANFQLVTNASCAIENNTSINSNQESSFIVTNNPFITRPIDSRTKKLNEEHSEQCNCNEANGEEQVSSSKEDFDRLESSPNKSTHCQETKINKEEKKEVAEDKHQQTLGTNNIGTGSNSVQPKMVDPVALINNQHQADDKVPNTPGQHTLNKNNTDGHFLPPKKHPKRIVIA